MKFIILLLCSEFAFLASSQSLPDALYQLINLNEQENTLAQSKVSLRYDQTKTELNEHLNQNIIPSLYEIYEDLEIHIENMENVTAFGYNPTRCVTGFRKILTSGVVANVTDKVINEINVYESIVSNINSVGVYNLEVVSNEIQSITTDFTLCITSSAPNYCNGTLYSRMLSKQEELPTLYDKEVEGTTTAFVQLVVNYKNRAQDYLQEAIASTKPYMALLESCVAVVLTKG